MAAGNVPDCPARDVLGDVLAVFEPADTGLHWAETAERLARRFPDRWADASAEAVSAQCRGLGVPSVDVKRAGRTATRRPHCKRMPPGRRRALRRVAVTA